MATSTAVKPSLTLKRRFNAPPEKVFSAWTDPEKVKRWMGPGEVKVLSTEVDARTGGRFRWVMQAPDGEKHDVSGVFREFIPNEKLVFTWAWISTPERESLVTLTFKPDGDGTLFTMTHEQFFDEAGRDSHNKGWTGAMDKLAEYLSQQ
jgi:uncharacterized protein YndB with AHSA1/START domain